VTGPLAQQFAQVRRGLNLRGQDYEAENTAFAALDVIEQHVQDMETALRPFVPDIPGIYVEREYEEAVGIYVLPVHLREARRVLAALPASGTPEGVAREKEEE